MNKFQIKHFPHPTERQKHLPISRLGDSQRLSKLLKLILKNGFMTKHRAVMDLVNFSHEDAIVAWGRNE